MNNNKITEDSFIKRSSFALYREAEDNSILILTENTGRAFLIQGEIVPIWNSLDDYHSVSSITNSYSKNVVPEIIKVLNVMYEAGLIQNNSKNKEDKNYFNSLKENLSGLNPLLNFQGNEISLSEIEFGACHCRWIANIGKIMTCNNDGSKTTSIVE